VVNPAKLVVFAALALAFTACTPKPKLASSARWAGGADGPPPLRSTAADRHAVEVTIYNDDIGLVKETRNFTLPAGPGVLRFVDVAERIDPVTVLITPLSGGGDFSVIEQNYEYDLISPAKLLEKYVGREIKLMDRNEYHGRQTAVSATLVSVNAGEVYNIDDSIHLGHPGIKVLPEIPGNLISRPTLSWRYENKAAADYKLEVSYVTAGMKWEADYILFVPAPGDTAGVTLTGWVTIDNRSGVSFEDAKLKLVAGVVNKVPKLQDDAAVALFGASEGKMYAFESPEVYMLEGAAGGIDHDFYAETAAPRFERSEMFEYKMYDLQRPTSFLHNQKKQVNFMEAHGVKMEREYVVNFDYNAEHSAQAGRPTRYAVNERFKFKNSEDNKLGDPLPAGTVRIYAADTAGRNLLTGEDNIGHTAGNEEVVLRVGGALDIVAERTEVNFRQISGNVTEREFMISVRNRKDADIAVRIEENAGGEWEIREASHKYEKVDAVTFTFDVPVPRGQEAIVRYRIRSSW